jgi:hypothetical protein
LEETKKLYYQASFPYELREFDAGLKYIGFQLKPNFYKKEHFHWLIAKMEKRLKIWSFRWLYRVGWIVLVKSTLEVIPFY